MPNICIPKDTKRSRNQRSFKSASLGSYCAEMKYKIIWTADLHKKFLKAVQKLGVDNAVPKKIVELMKVKGLTRDHVASHLQKYRILSKKIANAYYQAQTSSNSSLIFKHEQKNWPSYNNGMYMMNPLVLDTSSSYFPVLESSNFNSTVSFEFAHLSSLPNEGYSMPVMTKNLDEQGKLYDDAYNMGVVSSENSSNSWFMQNLDGFIYDYGACSTNVYSYNNTEMGSSSGVHLNKELAMCWNHEKPISIGKSSNSSFVESSFGFERNYFGQNEFVEMGSSSGVHLNKEIEMNMNYKKPLISTRNSNNSYFVESSIGFESNYIGQNECVEMGSCYGSNSKSNLENGIVEDDLMLNEDAMAFLLSYADGHGEYGSSSNNLALQHPNQDMKVNDQHFLDIGSFDSNLFNEQHSNEEIITKGYQQTLDGYIPTFDPTFNMPMWSPELLGDHMIYEDLFFDPFIED